MWKMIFSLWLIPVVLALVAAQRAANGRRTVTTKELRFLFGGSPQAGLSVWFWIVIACLAVGFLALGVVQAVILLNFNIFWAVITPLLTGALATLLLILLLRSRYSHRAAPRRSRKHERVAYSPEF